jgi:hypothetical protein
MHETEGESPSLSSPRPAWKSWFTAGARAAVFLRPRLDCLPTGPVVVGTLVLATLGVSLLLQRVSLGGEVMFYPRAVATGWLPLVLTAWACWLAGRRAAGPFDSARPGAGALMTIVLVKDLLITLPLGAAYVGLARWGIGGKPLPPQTLWVMYLGWLAWASLSGLWLLWRQPRSCWLIRGGVATAFALAAAQQLWLPGASYWYPAPGSVDTEAEAAGEPAMLKLTQAMVESQSAAVVQQLSALAPGRAGVIELYAITFAPYAGEDVFSREASMVSDVMRTRFDAAGRVLRLQNHNRSVGDTPWATPLNLERAIHAAAAKMNRDEDVLFLHLTSHGARDGKLAANFWPIDVDEVTPQQLRAWLDAAGVRHRVVSISACFSGSWIASLAEPGTLVMTAADAEHTSYGCGRKSELTFFGRAMYDEQLRTRTRSFEAAHAASRAVIDRREKEAGKSDGYSNPQIAMGAAIRPQLSALQARLDAADGR